MPNDGRLMKISEIAAAAGVSKQTVHFYLREGLLSPPVRKSRNMAYYDSWHIDEIRLIKELQEKRYLPLAVIKMVLDSRRLGSDLDSPDHLEMLETLFIEAKDEVGEDYRTLGKLVDETGLSAEQIEKMEADGLLGPSMTPEGKQYSGFDAALAKSMGRLLDLGMEVEDLPSIHVSWTCSTRDHSGAATDHPPTGCSPASKGAP